jgi:hypothetical protein
LIYNVGGCPLRRPANVDSRASGSGPTITAGWHMLVRVWDGHQRRPRPPQRPRKGLTDAVPQAAGLGRPAGLVARSWREHWLAGSAAGNPRLVQLLADVLGRPMEIAATLQTAGDRHDVQL